MTEQPHSPGDSGLDPVFSNMLAECPELWDVIEQFARGLPQQIDEMELAFANASYEQLVEWSRSLIQAGRGHGYPELAEYAAAVERSARDRLHRDIDRQLAELRDMAQQILSGIQESEPSDPKAYHDVANAR